METLGRQTSLTPSQKGIREGLLTGATSKFNLRRVAFLQGRRMGVPGRRHSPATGPGRTAGTIAYFSVTGAERAREAPRGPGRGAQFGPECAGLDGGQRQVEDDREVTPVPPASCRCQGSSRSSSLLAFGAWGSLHWEWVSPSLHRLSSSRSRHKPGLL